MEFKIIAILCLFFLVTATPTEQRNVFPVGHKNGARIIGGMPAHALQFPYVVGITINTKTGIFFCGGALLGQQWILTSGQCVENAVEFTISIGSIHLKRQDPNRITLATSEFELHPDFDGESLENDIALIKLRMPITFSDTIQAIHNLPTIVLADSVPASAMGWGQISDERPGLVDELQWVTVSTLTNSECQAVYGSQVTDSMVCIEGNFNQGSCNGDTGSPLIQYYSRGRAVPVGVASFISGNGCENSDPSGYTRVYPYAAWIRNITGLNI